MDGIPTSPRVAWSSSKVIPTGGNRNKVTEAIVMYLACSLEDCVGSLSIVDSPHRTLLIEVIEKLLPLLINRDEDATVFKLIVGGLNFALHNNNGCMSFELNEHLFTGYGSLEFLQRQLSLGIFSAPKLFSLDTTKIALNDALLGTIDVDELQQWEDEVEQPTFSGITTSQDDDLVNKAIDYGLDNIPNLSKILLYAIDQYLFQCEWTYPEDSSKRVQKIALSIIQSINSLRAYNQNEAIHYILEHQKEFSQIQIQCAQILATGYILNPDGAPNSFKTNKTLLEEAATHIFDNEEKYPDALLEHIVGLIIRAAATDTLKDGQTVLSILENPKHFSLIQITCARMLATKYIGGPDYASPYIAELIIYTMEKSPCTLMEKKVVAAILGHQNNFSSMQIECAQKLAIEYVLSPEYVPSSSDTDQTLLDTVATHAFRNNVTQLEHIAESIIQIMENARLPGTALVVQQILEHRKRFSEMQINFALVFALIFDTTRPEGNLPLITERDLKDIEQCMTDSPCIKQIIIMAALKWEEQIDDFFTASNHDVFKHNHAGDVADFMLQLREYLQPTNVNVPHRDNQDEVEMKRMSSLSAWTNGYVEDVLNTHPIIALFLLMNAQHPAITAWKKF